MVPGFQDACYVAGEIGSEADAEVFNSAPISTACTTNVMLFRSSAGSWRMKMGYMVKMKIRKSYYFNFNC